MLSRENKLNKASDLLLNRIQDIIFYVKDKNIPKFSKFYNEEEILNVECFLNSNKINNFLFFGGYNNSKRKILGVFPEYIDDKISIFPITPIKFSYSKKYTLYHKNFLWSLMNLNINRNTIGDILIGVGETLAFVHDDISDLIVNDIVKIANVGVQVSVERNYYNNFFNKEKFEYINCTVSSARLDCIVSFIAKCSRSVSCKMIKDNLVFINSSPCSNVEKVVKLNDILVLRGYGKYIFEEEKGKTKKDKFFIVLKKYM